MSAVVPHARPWIDTGGIKVGRPLSAFDWQGLAALANFGNGHGGMLVPWCHIGETIASGATDTFNFYVAPSARAVARIWVLQLRAATAGATAEVTADGGTTHPAVRPPTTRTTRRNAFVFLSDLSAKSSTAGGTTLEVAAAGGNIIVESVACYEETRAALDTDSTDYGVDITTLRAREDIADRDNESIGGVVDAYKNLDARRAGLFAWSTPEASAISPGSTSATDLFPLPVPMFTAIPDSGDTEAQLVCAAYAKVTGGTGEVIFKTSIGGNSATAQVTSTSYSWVTVNLNVACEDLSVADGRRSSSWEAVTIQGADPSAQTLSVAGIGIVRTAKPV